MLTPPFLVNLLAFKLRRVRRKRRLLPKKHHWGKFLGYNILVMMHFCMSDLPGMSYIMFSIIFPI